MASKQEVIRVGGSPDLRRGAFLGVYDFASGVEDYRLR